MPPQPFLSKEQLAELGIPASLRDASNVTRLDDKTYAANLTSTYCVGVVPNGGYVASVFLRVAHAHLAAKGHPDTLLGHWEFLGRTKAAPAVFVVQEVKLGRAMSVLHIGLYQDGLLPEAPWISPTAKTEVLAYVTNGNFEKEQGVTMPTGWELPLAPPSVDLKALAQNQDKNWQRTYLPVTSVLPSLSNLETYAPRAGRAGPATHDYWIRLANGEKFQPSDLGYVADCMSMMPVEGYRPLSDDLDDSSLKVANGIIDNSGYPSDMSFWYPTLAINLDIKKRLSAQGDEWLRVRIATKRIQNGRIDLEFLVFDADNDYVAGSHHVALAVDSSKNYAKREKPARYKI